MSDPSDRSDRSPAARRARRGVLAVASAAALAFAVAGIAAAQGPPGPGGGPPPELPIERVLERHADRLALSPETRAEVERLAAESRRQQEEIRAKLESERAAMRGLLSQDEPDEQAVLERADAISALEAEAHRERLRTMLRIRAQLTPEQRAALVSIREEQFAAHRQAIERACADDLAALCPDAAPGPGRGRCLQEHVDELSDGCRAVWDARPRRPGGPHGHGGPRGCGHAGGPPPPPPPPPAAD